MNEDSIEPVRILFATERSVETLWATPLAAGRYRIDNIPFETWSVSLGDVVLASPGQGMLEFEALYQKSGARTVWMQIIEKGGRSSEVGRWLFDFLRQRSYCFESFDETHLAASVPAEVEMEELLLPLAGWHGKLDFQIADPNPLYPMPVAPGSPATTQLKAIHNRHRVLAAEGEDST